MARRHISTNRPDTLTQTFFIHQLFPCSQTADHTFEKLRKPAFVPEYASGADDILTANSGDITLYRVTAQLCTGWRHNGETGGGIDCSQHDIEKGSPAKDEDTG